MKEHNTMGAKGTPPNPRPPAPKQPVSPESSQQLWIVGDNLNRDDDDATSKWEILGVFDDEQLAVAACTADYHFVGPITLNERLPDEPRPWPSGYYPRLEKKLQAVG